MLSLLLILWLTSPSTLGLLEPWLHSEHADRSPLECLSQSKEQYVLQVTSANSSTRTPSPQGQFPHSNF